MKLHIVDVQDCSIAMSAMYIESFQNILDKGFGILIVILVFLVFIIHVLTQRKWQLDVLPIIGVRDWLSVIIIVDNGSVACRSASSGKCLSCNRIGVLVVILSWIYTSVECA